jgi:hypothetical protein
VASLSSPLYRKRKREKKKIRDREPLDGAIHNKYYTTQQ